MPGKEPSPAVAPEVGLDIGVPGVMYAAKTRNGTER